MIEQVEAERVVARWPGVARVAVVAADSTAYVVPTGDRAIDPLAVLAHCRLHLAPHLVPTRVAVVEDLPS